MGAVAAEICGDSTTRRATTRQTPHTEKRSSFVAPEPPRRKARGQNRRFLLDDDCAGDIPPFHNLASSSSPPPRKTRVAGRDYDEATQTTTTTTQARLFLQQQQQPQYCHRGGQLKTRASVRVRGGRRRFYYYSRGLACAAQLCSAAAVLNRPHETRPLLHQPPRQKNGLSQLPGQIGGQSSQQMTPSYAPSTFHVPGKREPVSRLVFGTLRLHETERPHALLDEAWRLGIRALDTARVYGDGECERIVGEWIQSKKKQHADADSSESSGASENSKWAASLSNELTVITKGGCGAASEFWRPDLDPSSLQTELESSLHRLQLPAVDVYVLHRDEPGRDVGEICRTMQHFLDQNLVKAWGVSNWRADRVEAALHYARTHGLTPPTCSSLQDSLATPAREPWPGTVFMDDAERDWYARHRRVAVLGWETLGKGFLAGRWSRADATSKKQGALLKHGQTIPKTPTPLLEDDDDVYSTEWREMRLKGAYLHDANFARRERAARFAEARGYRPEHVAIAWCLAQPYESHVITATVNPDHLRSNVRALSLRLTPQDVHWLATGEPALPGSRRRPAADQPHLVAIEPAVHDARRVR